LVEFAATFNLLGKYVLQYNITNSLISFNGTISGIGASYQSVQLYSAVPYSTNLHLQTANSAIECAAKCNADFLSTSRYSYFLINYIIVLT
jgi:hypothetical protein